MQEKVDSFFSDNPDTNTVYGALGVLFLTPDEAALFLGGVNGNVVEIFERANAGTAGTAPVADGVKTLATSIEFDAEKAKNIADEAAKITAPTNTINIEAVEVKGLPIGDTSTTIADKKSK